MPQLKGTAHIMRYVYGLVIALLAVVAADFAVSNRSDVILTLPPLTHGIQVPVYAAVLVPLVLGLIAGRLLGWMAAAGEKRQKRLHRRRIAELETELKLLKPEPRPDPAKRPAPGAPGLAPFAG